MEEGISRKPVEVSAKFKESRQHVYDYTINTFGYFQAERYLLKMEQSLSFSSNFRHFLSVSSLQSLSQSVHGSVILIVGYLFYSVGIE
jgi:hypothetical protein